jgi:hypothetical protein
MSLTSYQAAPPRVLFENQVGSILETRNLISELFQVAGDTIRSIPTLTTLSGQSASGPWK